MPETITPAQLDALTEDALTALAASAASEKRHRRLWARFAAAAAQGFVARGTDHREAPRRAAEVADGLCEQYRLRFPGDLPDEDPEPAVADAPTSVR